MMGVCVCGEGGGRHVTVPPISPLLSAAPGWLARCGRLAGTPRLASTLHPAGTLRPAGWHAAPGGTLRRGHAAPGLLRILLERMQITPLERDMRRTCEACQHLLHAACQVRRHLARLRQPWRFVLAWSIMFNMLHRLARWTWSESRPRPPTGWCWCVPKKAPSPPRPRPCSEALPPGAGATRAG